MLCLFIGHDAIIFYSSIAMEERCVILSLCYAAVMEIHQADLQQIWTVIEGRLQHYRHLGTGDISDENGEVLLRQSLQMCQWAWNSLFQEQIFCWRH